MSTKEFYPKGHSETGDDASKYDHTSPPHYRERQRISDENYHRVYEKRQSSLTVRNWQFYILLLIIIIGAGAFIIFAINSKEPAFLVGLPLLGAVAYFSFVFLNRNAERQERTYILYHNRSKQMDGVNTATHTNRMLDVTVNQLIKDADTDMAKDSNPIVPHVNKDSLEKTKD